jgi:hypothetical protein
MPNYISLRSTAKRLLDASGRSLKLFRASTVPGDAQKPWRGPNSPPTSLTIRGVFDNYSLSEINGDTVKRGDKKVYVSAPSSGSLTDYDRIEDSKDKSTWSIVGIEPIEPGDTTLLYVLQVRQ